jgi:hypothetical protein
VALHPSVDSSHFVTMQLLCRWKAGIHILRMAGLKDPQSLGTRGPYTICELPVPRLASMREK